MGSTMVIFCKVRLRQTIPCFSSGVISLAHCFCFEAVLLTILQHYTSPLAYGRVKTRPRRCYLPHVEAFLRSKHSACATQVPLSFRSAIECRPQQLTCATLCI